MKRCTRCGRNSYGDICGICNKASPENRARVNEKNRARYHDPSDPYKENLLRCLSNYKVKQGEATKRWTDKIEKEVSSVIDTGGLSVKYLVRRLAIEKKRRTPACEDCGGRFYRTLRIIPMSDEPRLALDINNLKSYCRRCYTNALRRRRGLRELEVSR